MADLMNEVNFLRYYHTASSAVHDKDVLKNETYETYSNKISMLMAPCLALQMWQLSLTGLEANLAMYRKVRIFKSAAVIGACVFGSMELVKFQKQMTYLNRFYPEPTELQKSLEREAFSYKENEYKEKSIAERMAVVSDAEAIHSYQRFYSLGPQGFPEGEQDFNAAEHEEHH